MDTCGCRVPLSCIKLRCRKDTDATRWFSLPTAQAVHCDFFVGKAIGAVLREFAKTAPDAVAPPWAHDSRLSGLSLRR
jgi:3-methyladenine DNA glycosylase AlkD